jgi:hypothetical protein
MVELTKKSELRAKYPLISSVPGIKKTPAATASTAIAKLALTKNNQPLELLFRSNSSMGRLLLNAFE